MASIQIKSISVGAAHDRVFIVAEVGQNHQGSIEIAKRLIREAKNIGCDSVKFQKSDLDHKYTKTALNRPYKEIHSWGDTYGRHKRYLEFTINEMKELKSYCEQIGIIFSASAMDEVSLAQLATLKLDYIKIGSGDANNFPLLEKAALLSIPLIISTGMQTMSTIRTVVQIMRSAQKANFALLHCVSSYPTKAENTNLLTISLLKRTFPDVVIGYSGHENEPYISQAAVLVGAKIIERHITLDKTQKGSDHSCSLTPDEFGSMIKDIRLYEVNNLSNVPQSPNFIIEYLGYDQQVIKALSDISCKKILDCELPCRLKLGKSLVTARRIRAGTKLSCSDIAVKVSEPPGISAEYIQSCLGKELLTDLDEDLPILSSTIGLSNI